MANYIVSDTNLTAVANAIRTKGGTSAPLEFPDDFVSAIGDIQTGGGSSVTVEALSVTENGTYTAPTGKAYSPVTVNVSGGSVPIDIVAENLPNGWTGSTNAQNQIIDAHAPGTSSTYVRFTGIIPWNVNDTVEIKLINFGSTHPASIRLYVACNRGSQDLGTQVYSDIGFSFTGTNSSWNRDIVGFYFSDRSTGTLKTWSATVELYVNGVQIF